MSPLSFYAFIVAISPTWRKLLINEVVPHLQAELPCQTNITWSIEHVVPKSQIAITPLHDNSMNIIALPQPLNTASSNHSYGELSRNCRLRKLIPSCSKCPDPLNCPGAGKLYSTSAGKIEFEPPALFKAWIATSYLSFTGMYPFLKRHAVLEEDLAWHWLGLPYPPPPPPK